MLAVVVAVLQSHYVLGDDIGFELKLTNNGPEAIRVPNPEANDSPIPVLKISGPAMLSEVEAVRDNASPHPSMIDLAPGVTWEGIVRLKGFYRPDAPGTYNVRAEINWNGEQAVSNVVSFSVEPLKPSAIHYAFWEDRQETTVYVTWAQDSGGRRTLSRVSFAEGGGRDTGLVTNGPVRLGDLPKDALDPMMTAANFHPLQDVFWWTFWRDPQKLRGLTNKMRAPAELALPAGFQSVIAPPLMDSSHEADVFLMAGDGGVPKLYMARFVDPLVAPKQAPRLIQLPALPAKPAELTVALDPPGGANRRHVAFATKSGASLTIYHFSIAADGSPSAIERHSVDKLTDVSFVKDGRPAIFVASDGSVRISVFLTTANKSCLVETTFGGKKKPDESTTIEPIELPGTAEAARISYSPISGAHRRDWAVWLGDGKVVLGSFGKMRIVREHTSHGDPHIFVALEREDYILEVSPEDGIRLKQL